MTSDGLSYARQPERPGERVLGGVAAIRACSLCGSEYRPARPHQVYCSDRCRLRDWKSRQPMIEWTPAASEKAHAVRGRESKRDRILAMLRTGPCTSYQLALVTHRFGARVLELRQAGHVIEREDHAQDGREWSTYTLISGGQQ